nr:MAG TPA: hypothetical protein [Caudoviricetes sp.]
MKISSTAVLVSFLRNLATHILQQMFLRRRPSASQMMSYIDIMRRLRSSLFFIYISMKIYLL